MWGATDGRPVRGQDAGIRHSQNPTWPFPWRETMGVNGPGSLPMLGLSGAVAGAAHTKGLSSVFVVSHAEATAMAVRSRGL